MIHTLINLTDANDDRMLPHIVKMIQTNGEYVKLMQGLHENFLSCKITDMGGRDPSVRTKIHQAGDWLDFFDQLDIAVNARQRNEFMAYMAYPAAKFHMLFATGLLKFRIEYPRVGYQVCITLL